MNFLLPLSQVVTENTVVKIPADTRSFEPGISISLADKLCFSALALKISLEQYDGNSKPTENIVQNRNIQKSGYSTSLPIWETSLTHFYLLHGFQRLFYEHYHVIIIIEHLLV